MSFDSQKFLFQVPKAAQRGVQATQQLLSGLVDGLETAANCTVYVVDLMPSKLLDNVKPLCT